MKFTIWKSLEVWKDSIRIICFNTSHILQILHTSQVSFTECVGLVNWWFPAAIITVFNCFCYTECNCTGVSKSVTYLLWKSKRLKIQQNRETVLALLVVEFLKNIDFQRSYDAFYCDIQTFIFVTVSRKASYVIWRHGALFY